MSTDAPLAQRAKRVLVALPLFSQLPDDVVGQVVGGVREIAVDRGEILFHRGDPCRGFHCVVTGQIKLSVASDAGAERVVEIIGAGETFGEAVMFVGRPYPVTATAVTRAHLLLIPTERIDAVLSADPSFARQMLAGMSIRLHTLVADIEATALKTSAQRVAAFLTGEAGDANDVQPVVELRTSKALVAARLGLTPETLSRVLRDLADAGIILVQGRRVRVLDLAALAARGGVVPAA